MPQVVTCPCGQRFSAADHLTGKTVACPVCNRSLSIPLPRQPQVQRIVVSCDRCASRYATTRDNISKQLPCSNCGHPIIVGSPLPTQRQTPPSDEWLTTDFTSAQPPTGINSHYGSAAARRPTAPASELSQFLNTMEANKEMLAKIGGGFVGLSVVICAMEMVPGWGVLGLQLPPSIFYIIAVASGAVGGFLIGNRYCVPGMIGYAIANLGGLFLGSLPMYYFDRIYIAVLFILIPLGMFPGILIYRGLKCVQDSLLKP